MAKRKLDRIPPSHADMTQAWPKDQDGNPAEVLGMHPRLGVPIGRLVYRGMVVAKNPKLDTNGQPVYRRMLSGEPMNVVNVPTVGTRELIFYLESDGHSNIYKQPCQRPEVLRAEMDLDAKRQAAKDFLPELSEALLASGLTKDEILERLLAKREEEKVDVAPEPVAYEPEPEAPDFSEFPKATAKPDEWLLSDGHLLTGADAEQAKEAESWLREQKKMAKVGAAF